MIGGHKEVRPRLARGSRRIGVRQKKTRDAPGEGGFAYAGRSANNESLRQMSRQIGQNELPFHLGMTEAFIALARMRGIFKTVGLGTDFQGFGRHRSSPPSLLRRRRSDEPV